MTGTLHKLRPKRLLLCKHGSRSNVEPRAVIEAMLCRDCLIGTVGTSHIRTAHELLGQISDGMVMDCWMPVERKSSSELILYSHLTPCDKLLDRRLSRRTNGTSYNPIPLPNFDSQHPLITFPSKRQSQARHDAGFVTAPCWRNSQLGSDLRVSNRHHEYCVAKH